VLRRVRGGGRALLLTTVHVRAATGSDRSAVRRLVSAAGLPLDGLDDAVVLVAESDSALVGTVALERHCDELGVAFLLRSAAVHPAEQGRGVGTALTRAALALVDAEGAPVALLTETAEHWFPRFGFAPVPRDRLPDCLAASAELRGACPATARALLRPAVADGA
jgi:amino-acid N-acetyltransferase